jgi:hypothetical protein
VATIATVAVVAALTTACSSSKEHAAPASCDLSKATISTAVSPAGSAPGVIASLTRVGGMNESGAVTTVTVTGDGQVDALADGPTRPHRRGTLDTASLDGLRHCIDESGFLDIEEGYRGATQGKSGDTFCTVTDAPEVTVVAAGSSGETRTATGYALGVRGEGCDYGDPPALDEVYAALEQIRQVVSDTGSG